MQIGCDRGCKSRRNAGFRVKGRGFESISLQQRVSCEPDFLALSTASRSRIPLRKGVHPTSFNPRSSPTHRKSGAASLHPYIIPRAVVLDPAVTVHTPEWLFLSAGVRAVDHCVESICSSEANPYADAQALHGLSLLARGLPPWS